MIDPLKIHALADGEVATDELHDLRDQIAACEKSAAELQAIKTLKDLMLRAAPVECEETWKQCVKRLDQIDKTRRIESAVGRYAWGFCGVLFVAIMLGGLRARNDSAGVVRSGDVPQMVSGMVPFSSFKSDSPTTAQRWLQDNAPTAPMEMGDNRLQLVGGIAGVANGHRVVRLTLRDQEGDLALIMIHGTDELDGFQSGDGQYQQGKIDDINCVAWRNGNCAVLLVGDRDANELQTIASHIKIH